MNPSFNFTPAQLERVREAIVLAVKRIRPEADAFEKQNGSQQLMQSLISSRILATIYWVATKAAQDLGITHDNEDAQEAVVVGTIQTLFGGENLSSVMRRLIDIIDNDSGAMQFGKKMALNASFSWALYQTKLIDQVDNMLEESRNRLSPEEVRFAQEHSKKLPDSHNQWQPVPIVSNLSIQTILLHESGLLLVGTERNGVFGSKDRGVNWESFGLNQKNVLNLYMNEGNIYAICFGEGVFESPIQTNNWQHIGMQQAEACCALFIPQNRILLGTSINGLYDCVVQDSQIQVKKIYLENEWISCIKRNNVGDIFVGTLSGHVLVSEGGESEWRSFGTGITPKGLVNSIEITPAGEVFVASTEGGIIRLSNGKWFSVDDRLPTKHIYSLSYTANGFLYAGTYDKGIFYSTDGGKNWMEFNEGLQSPTVNVLGFTKDRVALAGTNRGLFIRQL